MYPFTQTITQRMTGFVAAARLLLYDTLSSTHNMWVIGEHYSSLYYLYKTHSRNNFLKCVSLATFFKSYHEHISWMCLLIRFDCALALHLTDFTVYALDIFVDL